MSPLYRFTLDPKHPARWATLLVLAECDYGDLWLPSRTRSNWWDRRFNPRNPLHWPYLLLSAVSGWCVLVEAL